MNCSFSDKIVVITGGRGCIGTRLSSYIAELGAHRIYLIDDLSSGVQPPADGVEFVHCDIANQEKLPRILKSISPKIVFHLAAHFANQNSVDHPRSDAMANIIGLINVFESLRELRDPAKLIYSSSSCVYGHDVEMSEDAPLRPYETPYAINKFAGELYVEYYSRVKSVPAASLRIFNTYGPGEAPGPYRNVIPNFIQRALSGLPIVITGTGAETRDFTYLDDTVNLLVRLADSPYREGEVFNGGTGVETAIKDLAEMVVRLTGSSSHLEFRARRDWDAVTNRCAVTSKSRKLLGYDPRTPLEEGLRSTIEWVRAWRASAQAVAR